MNRDPVWECSREDGYYVIEASAKHGCFRLYAHHAISQAEFDNVWCKRAMLENGIERIMDEFRRLVYRFGAPQEKLSDWPRQKYDNSSITCIQS